MKLNFNLTNMLHSKINLQSIPVLLEAYTLLIKRLGNRLGLMADGVEISEKHSACGIWLDENILLITIDAKPVKFYYKNWDSKGGQVICSSYYPHEIGFTERISLEEMLDYASEKTGN